MRFNDTVHSYVHIGGHEGFAKGGPMFLVDSHKIFQEFLQNPRGYQRISEQTDSLVMPSALGFIRGDCFEVLNPFAF